MNNREFRRYHVKYKSVIQAIARKYAGADQDLFDDLVQVATIGLLDADLRRPYKNEDAFLRQVIRNKVVDHLRWLDYKDFDSLDQRLAQGDQIVKDFDGEITFVHGNNRKDPRNMERPLPERPDEDDDYDG